MNQNANLSPLVLKFSPNVRIRMTVAEEMALDKDGLIFTDALREKYLAMHKQAVARQDATLKTLIFADLALALLLFGKNIGLPGTTLSLQDIPAATQVFTALASFGFLTVALAFLNAQTYQAVIEQFDVRRTKATAIDPDYLTAADTFSELYLKAFRRQMNVFGQDFYDPGKGYKRYYFLMVLLISLSYASILLLHLSAIAAGIWATWSVGWMPILFCIAVVLMNTTGILVNVLLSFDFVVKSTDPETYGSELRPPRLH